jgi:heme-degrading monooxygenase HmoA
MWLNCTRSRVNPVYVGRVLSILESEPSLAPLQAARGFRGVFLVESTETPGELISITWWASAEEGQAYLASPECREVIESIQEYLVRPLERSYYEVLIEASPQQENQAR